MSHTHTRTMIFRERVISRLFYGMMQLLLRYTSRSLSHEKSVIWCHKTDMLFRERVISRLFYQVVKLFEWYTSQSLMKRTLKHHERAISFRGRVKWWLFHEMVRLVEYISLMKRVWWKESRTSDVTPWKSCVMSLFVKCHERAISFRAFSIYSPSLMKRITRRVMSHSKDLWSVCLVNCHRRAIPFRESVK